MVPRLVASVEEARAKIKDVFRERTSERAKTFVEGWKTKKMFTLTRARPPLTLKKRNAKFSIL